MDEKGRKASRTWGSFPYPVGDIQNSVTKKPSAKWQLVNCLPYDKQAVS
jgi:hypothetical protein